MVLKKIFTALFVCLAVFSMACGSAAAEGKIGYVDLRKAFYEYEKTKTLEQELNDLTEERQEKRTKMIEEITKLRDEAALLSGDARAKKEQEIEPKLSELQEFDRDTRQQLLNRKNDMFREVIDDIQVIVQDMGETEGYDYVLDSRNIMYAKPDYDMTETVIEKLNQ